MQCYPWVVVREETLHPIQATLRGLPEASRTFRDLREGLLSVPISSNETFRKRKFSTFGNLTERMHWLALPIKVEYKHSPRATSCLQKNFELSSTVRMMETALKRNEIEPQPQPSLELDPYPPPKATSYVPPPPGSRPCVVCKSVHLSCDRARPCSRCVRLGREKDCCDPPEYQRGRPKLAEGAVKRKKSECDRSGHSSLRSLQADYFVEPTSAFEDCIGFVGPVSPAKMKHLVAQGRLWYYWNRPAILGCSPEFASYMDYPMNEVIGLSFDRIHPPEVIQKKKKERQKKKKKKERDHDQRSRLTDLL